VTFTHALKHLPAALAATAALSAVGLVASAGSASAAPTPQAATTLSASSTSLTAAPLTAAGLTTAKTSSTQTTSALSAQLVRAAAVVSTAASLKGRPYVYGASGPTAFDCSGYTKYVLRKNGISVPRTAQQQYRAAKKISKSQVRPGDLVFFVSGDYAYHVGIYAGNGKVWHSPRSGSTVKLAKIWTSNWRAGRVV
jgi:cell wall-associated NlpC family hydrolase